MKKLLLQLVIGLMFFTTYAQFGEQQIISSETQSAKRAIPFDIDDDGFVDILVAYSGTISWYINLNGEGDFGPEQVITNTLLNIEDLQLHDMDNDGDLDILYKTLANDKIAWIENLNSQGDFGLENIIANTNYSYVIQAGDIDNDGDIDVASINYNEGLIWYENLDGLGNFSESNLLYSNTVQSHSIAFIDYNNNGLLDIIIPINNNPGELILFVNNGNNFNEPIQIYQADFIVSSWTVINNITVADLNGDGKQDVLFDSVLDGDDVYIESMIWIENLDEQGSFSEAINIDDKYSSLGSLRTFDVDNDGYLDILASFFKFNHLENSTIAWYKNEDGLGSFGPQQIISTEVIRVTDASAADINYDGKIDIVSASSYDNKIAWYENLGNLSVSDNSLNQFNVFPSPTNGIITITSIQNISTIEIYNVIGQKISEIKNQTQIDLSSFDTGIYFLKINDDSGNSEIHKVIKE